MNRQILLASRPNGEPTADNFRFVESAVPEDIPEGNVLVRNHFLSLDPYMRGRMNASKDNYAPPHELDTVMIGGTVGEVILSKHQGFAKGDLVVLGNGGWQQYSLYDANKPGLGKIDASLGIPISAYLGVVGMPGVTAWYGLTKIIQAKAGETVVVSAASGAVGSIVGQLAKLRGCRAVGLAGGQEKCDYVVKELGFDACIDYKQHGDLQSLVGALKEACPNGIDGYFENVGGVILDAVMVLANAFSRVAVCGMISAYNGAPTPMANPIIMLKKRMKFQGFIIGEHLDIWLDAVNDLAQHVAKKEIKYHETIADGIESAPEAFFGLLKGKNFGKQLVRLN